MKAISEADSAPLHGGAPSAPPRSAASAALDASPEAVLRALLEPAFLVTQTGTIVVANAAAAALLGRPASTLREARLSDLTSDDPARVSDYLSACARTRAPIPGALHFTGREPAARHGVSGSVVRPAAPDAPAIVLLRVRVGEGPASRFNLLNRQLGELTREIRARSAAEAALVDANAQLNDQTLEQELVNQQLQDQTLEMEHQTEEAQALADELATANERLQRSGDRAERLLVVSSGLSAAVTAEEVADVIFRDGLAAIGADAGSFGLVRENIPASADAPAGDALPAVEIELVRSSGYSDELVTKFHRFPLTPGRPLSDAVRTQAPVLLTSWDHWHRAYPDTAREVEGTGYEAFAAIPVLSHGRVLAALSASFRTPIAFDTDTRIFLATLGEQCGLALERARAHEAEQRAREASAFLAEASQLLTASLDYAATLRAVAEAAVPRLGDWCAVQVIRDPTATVWPPDLERIAIVHRDPAMLAFAAMLSERYPTDWSVDQGVPHVLRHGTPLFLPVLTDAMLVAGARDAEHLELLRSLHFRSLIVVPLVARGRTLGALSLCRTGSARRYDASDMALAQTLAQRAALAVDNARLFRDAEVARLAAEEANRGKSQFLATMSHELRTPLNAIGGYVELLELGIHGAVTDAQHTDLERIQRAQRHLLALINEVLNFARVEAGQVRYTTTVIPLEPVLRGLEPLIAPQVQAQGLHYQCESVPDDAAVWADREKLEQILLNLLSNAVKFTPPGGTVTLSCEVGDDRVAMRVRDTGVGISADKLERVFEPFVQLDQTLTRPREGIGLGLAISRDLARGMGGDLIAESAPGGGSTFTLTLPGPGHSYPADSN